LRGDVWKLNHRERFLRTFEFKEVDRVPDYEFGYWAETIDRWHREGLPMEKKTNREIELYLGLEGWDCIEMLPIRTGLWPTLPERIIREEKDRAIVDDGMGGIYIKTTASSSVPHYIRHPLKNKDDWEKLRPFFDPDTPGRFPLNWEEVAKSYRERDYPLGIHVGSLYGWLRNWMGVERISIAFYRDPEWIAEMMDVLVNLWIKIIRRALRDVKVDFATWWEDMCYSRGPLISVKHFEEFMVPRYRRVTEVLKEYGVYINIVDSDGDISLLVPGWLKAGINCMFPLEARFTNVYKLRKEHGNRLLLMGGVNKFALMDGGVSIRKELERLTPLLREGGYIPMVDHRVPPEVSYSTYLQYLREKREWIGRKDI
jgi:uroporphyrinogen decarboxylase